MSRWSAAERLASFIYVRRVATRRPSATPRCWLRPMVWEFGGKPPILSIADMTNDDALPAGPGSRRGLRTIVSVVHAHSAKRDWSLAAGFSFPLG